MKKIKIVVTAIAIISAGVAAIPQIVKAVTPPPPTEEVLYWFNADSNADAGENTLDNEIPDSGCDNNSTQLCEKGYRADQFNTNGVRSSGVKTTEVNNFTPIYKTQQ